MAVPFKRDRQPEDGVSKEHDRWRLFPAPDNFDSHPLLAVRSATEIECRPQRRLPRWDDFIQGYSSGPLASTLDPRARLRFTERRKKQRQEE